MVASRAATVPWRDCDECLPSRTIDSLPPDGVALQILLSREDPGVAKASLTWPPQIHRKDLSGIEGVSNHYGVYQRFAHVGNGEYAYVWAFFGRANPTDAQLAKANAELASTHLR